MKNKFMMGITAIATIACFGGNTPTKNFQTVKAAWKAFYNAHQPLRTTDQGDDTRDALLKMLEEWSKSKLSAGAASERIKRVQYDVLITAWIKDHNLDNQKVIIDNLQVLLDAYIQAVDAFLY